MFIYIDFLICTQNLSSPIKCKYHEGRAVVHVYVLIAIYSARIIVLGMY